jgi:isoleucyl-tRNA synthetase
VALDVTITPQLKEEGIARELVNRIQNIRKDLDFEVTDRIAVLIQHHDLIARQYKTISTIFAPKL